MHSAIRVAVASAIVATATFIISADTTPASEASEVQLRIGICCFAEGASATRWMPIAMR
jgi:hypothetical protein